MGAPTEAGRRHKEDEGPDRARDGDSEEVEPEAAEDEGRQPEAGESERAATEDLEVGPEMDEGQEAPGNGPAAEDKPGRWVRLSPSGSRRRGARGKGSRVFGPRPCPGGAEVWLSPEEPATRVRQAPRQSWQRNFESTAPVDYGQEGKAGALEALLVSYGASVVEAAAQSSALSMECVAQAGSTSSSSSPAPSSSTTGLIANPEDWECAMQQWQALRCFLLTLLFGADDDMAVGDSQASAGSVEITGEVIVHQDGAWRPATEAEREEIQHRDKVERELQQEQEQNEVKKWEEFQEQLKSEAAQAWDRQAILDGMAATGEEIEAGLSTSGPSGASPGGRGMPSRGHGRGSAHHDRNLA